MLKQVWSVICTFAILSGCYIPEEIPESRMKGYVGFSYPVVGGHVRIWEIHPIDGSLVHPEPIAETITDENGEFDVEMMGFDRTLLLTVHGGTTKEYWEQTQQVVSYTVHLSAVIPSWSEDSISRVAITPWTTLADIISETRWEQGERDDLFYNIATQANQQIYEHVVQPILRDRFAKTDCEANLVCLVPTPVSQLHHVISNHGLGDEHAVYTVSLLSLSASASERAKREQTYSDGFQAMTMDLVRDLAADAQDNGILDGSAEANTTSETLRAELVTDAIGGYWATDMNETGIDVEILSNYFCDIVRRHNSKLFGLNRPQGLPWLCAE